MVERGIVDEHYAAELAREHGGSYAFEAAPAKAVPVHTLDITPELREAAVGEGFPLFQKGQGEGGPRGRITLAQGRAVVDLFGRADRSTFLHEMGHLWLDELAGENVPQALKDDLGTVLRWLGVDTAADIGAAQHERWAQAFERYLAEGNAPSSALARAFEQFKQWLAAIYRSLADISAPLSADVKAVMDRMLASDEEIAARASSRGDSAGALGSDATARSRISPIEAIAALPPRAQEDAMRASVAALVQGEPVAAGEMIEAAARSDPRIAAAVERGLSPYGTIDRNGYRVMARRSELAMTGDRLIDRILASEPTRNAIDNPQVDRSHTVPYTAGGSVPLEDPTMFVDRRFPRQFTVRRISDPARTVTFDPAEPFAVHENLEQHVMEILVTAGMPHEMAYRVAHFQFAEVAEGAWYRARDIDQAAAEAAYEPHMERIQRESADDVPANLYKDPYPHDRPSAAAHEALAEARPTAEEIARAREILERHLAEKGANERDLERGGRAAPSHVAPSPRPSPDSASQTRVNAAAAGEREQEEAQAVHVGPKAKRGRAAADPDTWSLLEFLASRGGLKADDPLIGDVRGSIGRDQKFVPGFGPLIRKTGMPLDQAREAAVEAGYIFDAGRVGGGEAQTTVATLLEAIDSELRGQRVYRAGHVPAAGKAELSHQREAEAPVITRALEAELEAVGIKPDEVDSPLKARVVEMVQREGERDLLAAYERAVEEMDLDAVGRGEEPAVEAIPGWDVPADAGAAPPARGAAAPVESSRGAGAGAPARSAGAGDREAARAAAGAGRDAAWRELSRRQPSEDDPETIAAAQAAERLPEPGSIVREDGRERPGGAEAPSQRLKAALEAEAQAEAFFQLMDEPYLAAEERARLTTALAELAQGDKDAQDVLRYGAACLMAAVGGVA
jgi:hypothetical protein